MSTLASLLNSFRVVGFIPIPTARADAASLKTIGRLIKAVQSFSYLPVSFATGERCTRMAPVGQNS